MIKHLIQFTGACEPDWNWACAILWINILWKAHLSVLSLKATDQTEMKVVNLFDVMIRINGRISAISDNGLILLLQ